MKSTYSYKSRFYLLLFGCFLFLILSYNLAFRKTVFEMRAFRENSHQFANLQDAPLQLKQLDLKLKSLNCGLPAEKDIESNGEVLLLEKANFLIRGLNLKITELPHYDIYLKNGFRIKTQTIIIQGPFNQTLTFLHSMERDRSLGNIRSVDYYSQKESGRGTILLKMKVYFQTITED